MKTIDFFILKAKFVIVCNTEENELIDVTLLILL